MHPRIAEIVAEVSAETFVTGREILGRALFQPVVKARHEVWRRVRLELGWSYPEIGKRFGVDASSVTTALNGRRKAKREAERAAR